MFGVDLGASVCGDEVGQAPGERGVPLVNTATAFADHAVVLMSADGASTEQLGGTDVWTRGRNVGWVARGWVGQHEPPGQ